MEVGSRTTVERTFEESWTGVERTSDENRTGVERTSDGSRMDVRRTKVGRYYCDGGIAAHNATMVLQFTTLQHNNGVATLLKFVTALRQCHSIAMLRAVALPQLATLRHYNTMLRAVALKFTLRECGSDGKWCLIILQRWQPLPPKFLFFLLLSCHMREKKRKGGGVLKLVQRLDFVGW